jgi:drug/metabolite transporter (DMT)-like permease
MEEFNIYSAIGEGLSHFFGTLDWRYIITLILITHYLVKDEIVRGLPFKIRGILIRVPIVWRVIIIGVVHGIFIYWIRDYKGKEGVETIVQSLFVAIVCHKLFLAQIIKKFDL